MLSHGGLSPYLHVLKNDGRDSDYAQDASISGQFGQQWKLRTVAQGATSKKIANRKLRRLQEHDKSFECADAEVGDSVLFYKLPGRGSGLSGVARPFYSIWMRRASE